MGVTYVGQLGGRSAHVGPLRCRAGHVGRLRGRAGHAGPLRGRAAAPDESRKGNASRLQSQGTPWREGCSNHIQSMGGLVTAWPSVRSLRRVHEFRLVLCTSLLDRLGTIWGVDEDGFSLKN